MKPAYHIKEVKVQEIEELRCKRRKKVSMTVDGSSMFHVLVFKPKESFFLASPRLCICDECKQDYGSFSLFYQHELNVQELQDIPLRSDDPPSAEIVVKKLLTTSSYLILLLLSLLMTHRKLFGLFRSLMSICRALRMKLIDSRM